MLSTMEIERRHTYVAPDEQRAKKHKAVGDAIKALAHYLNGELPAGRQSSIVQTLLEEVRMRSNAAIAVDGTSPPVPIEATQGQHIGGA